MIGSVHKYRIATGLLKSGRSIGTGSSIEPSMIPIPSISVWVRVGPGHGSSQDLATAWAAVNVVLKVGSAARCTDTEVGYYDIGGD